MGVFPSASAVLGSGIAAKSVLGKRNTTPLQVLTGTQALLSQWLSQFLRCKVAHHRAGDNKSVSFYALSPALWRASLLDGRFLYG